MYSTQRQHSSRELAGGLVTVPTVAADLSTVDTWVAQIHITNPTAGALTVTIKDKQGTPRNICPTISIPANGEYLKVYPHLLLSKGGVNWVASGAGLEAEVFGFLAG